MQKEFEIVVVDDNPDTVEVVFQAVKSVLKLDYH